MADSASAPAVPLLMVGLNHQTASAALRDRLFAAAPDPEPLLADLKDSGIAEGMVLATCERLELLAVSDRPQPPVAALLEVLARHSGMTARELVPETFSIEGPEALRHLFAVTAALESSVLGETQILGQVRACHRQAAAAGMVAVTLEQALGAAYAAAKRVRRETPLAEQPASMAASARDVAQSIHGNLGASAALLLGLGEMGELLAAEFQDAGVADLVVMHGTLARAETVARRLQCHCRPWAELPAALAAADIVVADQGAGQWTVTGEQVRQALQARRRRPIFFIDAALPGDIEPAVEDLDDAFVYNLDDLERVALAGKTNREVAAALAWKVLEEELASHLRRSAERGAVPSVTALRQHFEALRQEVLADSKLDAAAATERLVKRLLHAPSENLRQAAARDPAAAGDLEQALRRLFQLEEGQGIDVESDKEEP